MWIGYITGAGDFPDSIKLEGRRIWSWSGGRLECSQLAKKGAARGDRLGEWGEVEIGCITPDLIEKYVIDPALCETAKGFASYEC